MRDEAAPFTLSEILRISLLFENRFSRRETKLTFIERLLCMSGLVQVFIDSIPLHPHANPVR